MSILSKLCNLIEIWRMALPVFVVLFQLFDPVRHPRTQAAVAINEYEQEVPLTKS